MDKYARPTIDLNILVTLEAIGWTERSVNAEARPTSAFDVSPPSGAKLRTVRGVFFADAMLGRVVPGGMAPTATSSSLLPDTAQLRSATMRRC